MPNKFNPDRDEFILMYDKLNSSRKMSEYYGVDKKTITSYAKRIEYKYGRVEILSEEDKTFIIENYENFTGSLGFLRYQSTTT